MMTDFVKNLMNQIALVCMAGFAVLFAFHTRNSVTVCLKLLTHILRRNLSKTRIWHLPTDGLINIKELNVEDVPSLKQFPSVLKFSHIDVARLTYPHHCCAFQHPEKQDPDEYMDYEQQRQLKQQRLQQLTALCASSSPATPTVGTSPFPLDIPALQPRPGQVSGFRCSLFFLLSG